MESNPMFEEVWHVPNEWARTVDDEIHRLCQNTRQQAAEHPRPGLVVQDGKGLRCLAAEVGRLKLGKDVMVESLILNDSLPTQANRRAV